MSFPDYKKVAFNIGKLAWKPYVTMNSYLGWYNEADNKLFSTTVNITNSNKNFCETINFTAFPNKKVL